MSGPLDPGLALAPPWAGVPAPLRGVIKRRPADFQVVEIPAAPGEAAAEPAGANHPHLWLELEREDMTTAYAVRLLARAAGVAERDVGFAGLKDRHARSRQWFSIPAAVNGPRMPDGLEAALDAAGLKLEHAQRNPRKLRRGALAGNRFRIRVALEGAGTGLLDAACARVRAEGVPNYFGPQRFGHAAANLQRAHAMLCDGVRVRDRGRRSLYLSAARSILFNRVLAARVRAGTWNRLLDGEAVSLAGSASFFVAGTVDDALLQRLAAFDLHPSGPLWGRGETAPQARAGEVEREALAGCDDLMAGIERAGAEAARRALRLRVEGLNVAYDSDGCVLDFGLEAGAYATVVLRELFHVVDASALDPGEVAGTDGPS